MKSKKLIITIDGPAGAGKSTLAKLLAQKLGYLYLDTGAMYRAVALAAKEKGIDFQDHEALGELCRKISLELRPSPEGLKIILEGRDVSQAIRTPEIDHLSSLVAQVPQVRECLRARQRALASEGNVVAEGRDMGTQVFPEAPLKFFLTASAEERARRRHQDHLAKGLQVEFEEILEDILKRDQRDQKRKVAPLKIPEGAIVIDTSGLSVEEVLEKMLSYVKKGTQTESP